MCVMLGACGLERDWQAWQALKTTADNTTSSETGPGSTTGTSTDDGASSSTDSTAASPASGHAEASTASTGTTTNDTAAPGDTGSTTGTTGPATVCGDGVVEGEEECDDPGDTACFNCVRDRLVFVTSKFNLRGDFALGPESLDYWCNFLAAEAGLLGPDFKGRFKPWISTSAGGPAERLHHSRGRYVLRNGLVFALSWDALVAGEILNTPNVDENSQTRNVLVWTDAAEDGSALPGEHCNDWTSDSLSLWAHYGYSAALDGQWTRYTGEGDNPTLCVVGAALYCFESP